ncbi:hypothetical protein CWC31_06855 [Pseudoalteromonas ruthenica]|uniref:hypothetical protein n=1 Tax=Pseudoalteromonas ruthenica TaxID=151081 RepID=UPI001108A9A5|nr:hypothetical protein [Pseudoalteromonas ruthenica]TLX51329.1 hypothetical protein CWC31_06855 [Pseudoalteromonas ruthenica]
MFRKWWLLLCVFAPCVYGQWQITPAVELGARQYNGESARVQQTHNFAWDPRLWLELDYRSRASGIQAHIKPVVTVAATNSALPEWDLQEAYLQKTFYNWQLSAGMNTVFWGVAESRHLVDIVNQRIPARNFEGEEKLGELLVQVDYFTENGTLSLLSMPWFRSRDYSQPDERFSLPVAISQERFVGLSEHTRESLALRYATVLDDWDVGAYFFHGLDKTPAFEITEQGQGQAIYSALQQWGLDAQYTSERWLGKLEAVHRNHDYGGSSWAYTLGGEYYFYGVAGSSIDLSLLLELHRDTDAEARENQIYRNSSFVGSRLAWNDTDATTLLLGALIDNGGDSIAIKGEFETRIHSQLSLDIEARMFVEQQPQQPLYLYRDDDFIEVRLTYYL